MGQNEYVTKQQKALALYGAESQYLYGTLELQVEQLNELKKKLDQAKIDVDARLSNVFILQTAAPAERKTYPIRWMILVGSVIGTFVVSCIVLLFIEKFKNEKENFIA